MTLTLHRLGLLLVLLAAIFASSPARADSLPAAPPPPANVEPLPGREDLPEPPPAPLSEPEVPEPEPAALEPVASPPPAVVSPKARPAPRGRALRNTAWAGTALTLALLTTGTVLGVLAQQRSDSLSRATTQVVDGLAPVYDASQRATFTDLQSQGQTYNNVTIGCFFAGGATALVSAILFWKASQLQSPEKALALVPAVSASGGAVTLMGRF